MIEPITQEEFAKKLGEVVARARLHPPRLEWIAPPINARELMGSSPGPLYEGFEDDIKRMRRGLEPFGPRK